MAITLRKKQIPKHSPHYCAGVSGNRVAFMLSVPGKEEAENGWPVWGDTGDNLERVLISLNNEFSHLFPYAGETGTLRARYHYRITNAVKKVYPNTDSEETEPPLAEVYNPVNTKRLLRNLRNIDFVVCLGDTAIKAYRHLLRHRVASLMIPGRHPGLQSLNQITLDDEGDTPEGRRLKRIEIAAQEISAYIRILKAKSPLLQPSEED
jgi:uracil-DNA glycosylase